MYALEPSEFKIGFFMDNGEDELGNKVHIITIGLLLFSINITRYL